MEEIKKGGSTPEKGEEERKAREEVGRSKKYFYGNAKEEKEAIATLTQRDYDRLDSIYTRIVNANDDLISVIEAISGERGAVTTWYILSTIKESLELGINSIEKILRDEVK